MGGVRWGWLYQNGDGRFTLPDALGSTAVFAQDGTVQASRLYPFGEEAQATSAEYKWTNQIRDGNGLDHFAFRTYSSNLARWLSPDPAGLAAVNPADPSSWNRYAYVENQPLALSDPLGLCPPDWVCTFVSVYDSIVGLLGPGGMGGMDWGRPKARSDAKPDHPHSPGEGSFSGRPQPDPVPQAPTPQQNQKKPCPPANRAARTVEALDAAGDALVSFNLAAVHFGAAFVLVSAGCLEPTPAEPLTCAAAGFGGLSLSAGGTVLTGFGVFQTKRAFSATKQAFTCGPG